MIRALYTAASGMMVESQRLDLVAHNLANVNTPGFRGIDVVRASRPTSAGGATTDVQTTFRGQFLNLSPGVTHPTNQATDLAVEGRGFFTVQTPSGVGYTRNGHFRPNSEGVLVDPQGNPVLGEEKPIKLSPTAKVVVEQDGTLFADGKRVDRLRLVDFESARELRPAGGSILLAPEGVEGKPADALVYQGQLEGANVSGVTEMGRMVEAMRAFESYQKVIQTVMDEVTSQAVRIGRLA